MTKKYIKYNGITFCDDTSFPFYEFIPNEGNVEAQTDIAVLKDGAIYSNFRYTERMVILKGHILGKDEKDLTDNKQLLFIKCNGKTQADIFFFDGYNEYKAQAVASVPTLSERKSLCYEFSVTFTLPYFYWEEANETVVPLFQRKNEVTGTFTLPCVFTSRTAGNIYFNETDFAVYPKIEFVAEETAEYKLIIENETTGATVELLDYPVNEGDVIAVDFDKMTATHNDCDIINFFNDFSDFCLISGKNEISITNGGIKANSTALIKFHKKMVGI